MLDHVGTALLPYNVNKAALKYSAVSSLFASVCPQMDQGGSINQDCDWVAGVASEESHWDKREN
eukprot:15366152-Ditylum_brightwellii.AAC.1